MKPTQKHTPTPWNTDGQRIYHEQIKDVKTIVGTTLENYQGPIDAAHIVKCVNLHDELVKATEELIEARELVGLSESLRNYELKDLLKRAKGEL